jgi:2-dehydro-3-deoxyphosphogalactonate aldolase
MPLIAILRGILPSEAAATGDVLVETGLRIIEVPLNSPDPLKSIEIMARRLDGQAIVGAGTVLSAQSAVEAHEAGARLIVAPNFDPAVVKAAKTRGIVVAPGVMTPSEAFAALVAGADALKLFPAEALPPSFVSALLAVLPHDVPIIPVGGITPETMAPYWQAGARGFGVGSALFKAGKPALDVRRDALAFVAQARQLTSRLNPPGQHQTRR